MSNKRILLVEDEKSLARFVELELTHEGYEVVLAKDGLEALEKALEEDFQIILLDLMLPKLSGIEVCRRVRKKKNIPIIMVTAKDDITDKVTGLDAGADDYITKPFQIEELLARIRAQVKRQQMNDHEIVQMHEIGNLKVNIKSHKVHYKEDEIDLTKKEYDLLYYLIENKGKVVYRESIIRDVWGYEFVGDTKVVDVYVRYLRGKIDQKYDVEIIKTVRGIGYMIDD